MQNEVYDVAVRESTPLTAAQIKAQVNLIQEVMQAVMKKDVHYGVIPGTPKPTLYKPGSEKILSTFRIGVKPVIEDLSTADEVRYRVSAEGFDQQTGALLGAGIGECSSSEEKYKWRRPVCDEEFNEAPEDRKRNVWKRGQSGNYQQKQIRTNPADVANTILKMAKKRAQIDMTLTVTAASDVFDQDLEDMPEELRQAAAEQKPPLQEPQKKSGNGEKKAEPTPTGEKVTAIIENVTAKEGEKNGKKYKLYTITGEGVDYKTFDRTFAERAWEAKSANIHAIITFTKSKWGNDIVNLDLDVPDMGMEEAQ